MKNYVKRPATSPILSIGAVAALIGILGGGGLSASADTRVAALRQYLANLPLSDQPFSREKSRTRTFERSTVPENLDLDSLQAAVDGKSLLSFVNGVSGQQKEDVLMSVLLAQRAANHSYNSSSEVAQWYERFTETLEKIGWIREANPFSTVSASQTDFLMDKEALKVIESIATKGGLDLLKEALATLNKTENDQQLELFASHSTSGFFGNFQLGAADVTENGDLVLFLGSFYFKTTEQRKRFLFFTWKSKNVELWASAKKLTLVEAAYSKVRDDIKNYATAGTRRFLAELISGS